jgi:hypothetical protein
MRLLSLAGAGCVMVASACMDRVPTSELNARVDATIDEHRIRAEIKITNRRAAGYEIEPDEHVVLAYRDQVVDCLFLAGADPIYDPNYVAEIAVSGDVAADEPLSLALDRGDGDVLRLDGMPPAPLTLDVPATSPFRSDLVINWSPVSDDPMHWYAEGGPDGGEGPIREDVGTLTFPSGVLIERPDSVRIRLERSHVTRNDDGPPFRSTAIKQLRTAMVELTP